MTKYEALMNHACNNIGPSRSLDEGTYTKNNILNLSSRLPVLHR